MRKRKPNRLGLTQGHFAARMSINHPTGKRKTQIYQIRCDFGECYQIEAKSATDAVQKLAKKILSDTARQAQRLNGGSREEALRRIKYYLSIESSKPKP